MEDPTQKLNNSQMHIKNFLIVPLLIMLGTVRFSFAQGLFEVKAKLNKQSFSYFVMDPGKKVNGILILFPGKGESAKSVFDNTVLPYELSARGYLTIVPELPYTLIADEFTQKAINQVLISQINKHESVKPNLILGGFSAGGSLAISLAEHYFQIDSNSTVRGVFAIDPPIDLARLYSSSENIIRSGCPSLLTRAARSTIDYLNHKMGGSPSAKSEEYLKLSPFSATDPRGGNAKYLENVPVRLYAEPDLNFIRFRYCKQLQSSDMNAYDLEKLNKILFVNSNSTCEYITTQGKGYHTWNILDVADAVKWIEEICKSEKQLQNYVASPRGQLLVQRE